MSNLDKKLLSEAFNAYVSEGDITKATRLFQHHWNMKAKECFQLLESEDEDFEVTDMGDDFNQEIADEAGSDEEQKFEQLQISVDELEDKFPGEMSEEVQAKFDELRNKIDELKLADSDDEVTSEDAAVAIEDLKADFEMAGDLSEDVQALFDEISAGIQGDEEVADEETEAPAEAETEEEPVEEAADEQKAEDLDVDVSFDDEATKEGEESEEKPVEAEGEDESEDLDIIYDAKESAEELLAKLDELEANEKAEEGEDVEASEEEDGLKEGFEKIKLPRNKLQNEEEGVKKEGMKFGKATTIPARKGMGVSHTVSAGESADKKVKVEKTENKGVKSWTKVAKPANEAKPGKSVLGN